MITEQKFQLGQVVMTRSINNTINESAKFAQFVLGSLRSHASGVWGDLCEEDKKENEYALGKYLRIFSSYDCLEDRKIWIITEADRKYTTILFSEEY